MEELIWPTVVSIIIYVILMTGAVGLCVWHCSKQHIKEAGTEYERLSSVELIPKESEDDRPICSGYSWDENNKLCSLYFDPIVDGWM